MRIALFGGTFDPPHRGHVAVATAAADAFALDRVLFAPTGRQPLKLGSEASLYATRLALTAAACEVDPRFVVSEIDAPRADNSLNYTVDTLAALAALHPGDTILNVAGADSFLSIRQWRSASRLLELAEWIVVTRPGYVLDESGLVPLALTPDERMRVHILSGVAEDVSATALRERLQHGDPCADLLPAPVAAFIAANGLYRHR